MKLLGCKKQSSLYLYQTLIIIALIFTLMPAINSDAKTKEAQDYYYPAPGSKCLFVTSNPDALDDESLFSMEHYQTLKRYRNSIVYANFLYHRFSSHLYCWTSWNTDPMYLLELAASHKMFVVYLELDEDEIEKYRDFIRSNNLKIFQTVKDLSSKNLKVELINI